MNRQEWTQIAEELAEQRTALVASWPPKGGYRADARDTHDRKLIYHATLDGFDRAARALCRALKSRSSRFDGAKFLRLVGVTK
jgi:hypothetical protein